MPREVSAGGVAVRRMRGRWWFAAIEPGGRPGVLALPKGLVEPGERPIQTALREVREETGLDCRPLADLGAVRYVYTRGGKRIFKVVSFHLLAYRRGRLGEIEPAMRTEIARTLWLPLERASTLAYRGERDMAERARELLAGGGLRPSPSRPGDPPAASAATRSHPAATPATAAGSPARPGGRGPGRG